MTDDDETEEDLRSRRQIARADLRDVGERSSKLAATLMKLSDSDIAKLVLDDDTQEAVDRARRITAQVARRRAERQLAGDLRRLDLDDAEQRLVRMQATGHAENRRFQDAERWRTRLLDGGAAALAEFPGGADDKLPALVEAAQKERATGKPPGAARTLFRHIVDRLKAAASSSS